MRFVFLWFVTTADVHLWESGADEKTDRMRAEFL